MIPDQSKNHILAQAALKFSLPGNVLAELTNQIPTAVGFSVWCCTARSSKIQFWNPEGKYDLENILSWLFLM